jgi:hypothetical protein
MSGGLDLKYSVSAAAALILSVLPAAHAGLRVSETPEPGACMLLGAGLITAAFIGRKRQKKSSGLPASPTSPQGIL